MITISHSDEKMFFRLSTNGNTHDMLYETPSFKITAKGSADSVYKTVKDLQLPQKLVEVLDVIYA